jgi:ankyrin repeat protein
MQEFFRSIYGMYFNIINPARKKEDLFKAAQNGDVEAIQNILNEKEMDVDVADENGLTALHLASSRGHLQVAKLLLENGAKINQKGMFDKTALHLAATNGHFAVAELLLENGAVIDLKHSRGFTALHLAVENSKLELAELLLENGADINPQDSFCRTPLHLAAENGKLEAVELLLENGADINLQNSFGKTALDVATRNGNDTIMHLLENRANADSAETIVREDANKTSIPIYCSESPGPRFVITVRQKQEGFSGGTQKIKVESNLNQKK